MTLESLEDWTEEILDEPEEETAESLARKAAEEKLDQTVYDLCARLFFNPGVDRLPSCDEFDGFLCDCLPEEQKKYAVKGLTGRLRCRFQLMEIDQLRLQRVVEALHDGVIPAISLSAHGTPYLMTVQKVLKLFARVLAPTVGVMNQPRFGLATGKSHFKGVAGQGLCHSFTHGLTQSAP